MTSTPGQPAVRAAYMKELFLALDARRGLAAMRRRDEALVEEVAAASRLAWLPVALNVRAVEAVCAELGEERGLERLAECVYAQFETPLWRSFISPAVRLLGRDPGVLGRWLPRALQIVFRDCGSWRAERTGEGELTLVARDLPPELARHRLWVRSLGIGMRPLFLVCGTDGRSELANLDAEAGRATYVLTWKPGPE